MLPLEMQGETGCRNTQAKDILLLDPGMDAVQTNTRRHVTTTSDSPRVPGAGQHRQAMQPFTAVEWH